MPRAKDRVSALERAMYLTNGIDAIIVRFLTRADETDNLWALTCDGNTWVRGDDEAEQNFIDRASADARKQQPSHRIAMLLQTDPQ